MFLSCIQTNIEACSFRKMTVCMATSHFLRRYREPMVNDDNDKPHKRQTYILRLE